MQRARSGAGAWDVLLLVCAAFGGACVYTALDRYVVRAVPRCAGRSFVCSVPLLQAALPPPDSIEERWAFCSRGRCGWGSEMPTALDPSTESPQDFFQKDAS